MEIRWVLIFGMVSSHQISHQAGCRNLFHCALVSVAECRELFLGCNQSLTLKEQILQILAFLCNNISITAPLTFMENQLCLKLKYVPNLPTASGPNTAFYLSLSLV